MTDRQQGRTHSGFPAKSEPEDILQGVDLGGKTAVVTGGYSGIGLETTRALANRGVSVFVPARDRRKAEENLADVEGQITIGTMDLADLSSISGFAQDVREATASLDLLINNAGIMACPETRVGQDWEAQFATNHFGHFVLTRDLLPLLLSADSARVVSLSSSAHKRSDVNWDDIHFKTQPYEKWTAYGQSKTANALFARGLDLRYASDGVQSFSVHPGGILTPLQRHLEISEMAAMGWTDDEGNLTEQAAALFKTPAQGCTTTLWAATSPALNGKGGVYCEDCDVADLQGDGIPPFLGVAEWATLDESADRLWDITERSLG
ncbi:MAG: oxidoreductase [Pseudomonadota bacterium]